MITLIRKLFWFGLFVASLLIATACLYYFEMEKEIPDVASLKHVELETPLQIYSKDGKLMAVFGKIKRKPVSIDSIPETLINAFIAIEDQRFYEHHGFDVRGILRAAVEFAKSGRKKQGASTITQQVAKNFFLTRERTFTRKIKELIISLRIERELTKREIMELYLNKIALGHNSYGVAAAAEVYFGKELKDLTISEMAVLAGLPKAPSSYNPISHPEQAKERRNLVLAKMLENSFITKEEYDAALDEPIISKFHGPELEFESEYIAEMARMRLIERFGEDITTKGIRVYTTVDSNVQKLADHAVFKGLMEYDQRHGWRGPAREIWSDGAAPWSTEEIDQYLLKINSHSELVPSVVTQVAEKTATARTKNGEDVQIPWEGMKWAAKYISERRIGYAPKKASDILKPGYVIYIYRDDKGAVKLGQMPAAESALISLDPETGAIRALVGGFSFKRSKFNRADQAKRQPGSNIKPFIYSAAFDNGYTLSTYVLDTPIVSWGKNAWSPKNSPNVYDGPISVRAALAKSKNVVSVRLLRGTGLQTVVEHLNKFGFNVPKRDQNDTLALGAIDLTPMQVVRGYAAIANGGFLINPYIVERIEDESGNVLYEANPIVACTTCRDHVLDQQAYATPDGRRIAPQIISHANSFIVSEAMHTGIYGGGDRGLGGVNGTGWRTARDMPKRHDLSGKTGTTNDSRDCWFSALNRGYVTTVWVGFDNHTSLGRESGATAAQPIWNYFMVPYMSDSPENPVYRPGNIVTKKVSRHSGLFMSADAQGTRNEFFAEGTDPAEKNQLAEEDYFNYGDDEIDPFLDMGDAPKPKASGKKADALPDAGDIF